ncbi:MAG: AAA family ATPase [Desulfomonilaceae bacterium]
MFLKGIKIQNDKFPVYDAFPFNIKALLNADNLQIKSKIAFFSGENGVGKSALLDAVARRCGFLPWGGSKTHKSHSNPYETQLANFIKLDFKTKPNYGFHFRAEVFFNYASSLDDILLDDPDRREYFGGGSLNAQSHGESFLTFFHSYAFNIDGLYLIDEPESALAPRGQIEFVKTLLRNIKSSNKQYIIATLSPIILACPGAQIMGFDEFGIKTLSFRNTSVYNLYKGFIDNPEAAYRS